MTYAKRKVKEKMKMKGGKKKPMRRIFRDFPGGAVVKNPPANAEDTGSSPGLERSRRPRSN